MKTVLVLLILLKTFGSTELQAAVNSQGGCFPENDLSFPVSSDKTLGSRDEFQARQILDYFKATLTPLVQQQMNKKLILTLDWENPRVNASATRDDNNNPMIILYGGMARHPLLTEDGLLAILCHELGHHMGGAPKKKRGRSEKRSWSSAEGQSDYYAASKCLPFLFKNPKMSRNLDSLFPKAEVDAAESHCGNDPICTRSALAGLSMTRVFASLKTFYQKPSFDLLDRTEVSETNLGHPKPQCRLDTVLSGLNCSVPPTRPFDPLDPKVGACYSFRDELGKREGPRPRCWYNPENY